MLRALLIGCLLCLFIGAGTVYANNAIRGTFMASTFASPVAFFLLFYLVAGNLALRPLAGRWALRREELALIFVMMLVSASIPTFGLVEHLLPMITGAFYYATPANGWATLIQPHIPSWIAPRDADLIRGFYEGLPAGEPIPWMGWVGPLSWWLLFLLALYGVSISAMVIMRRQWMERERLAYPMMATATELIDAAAVTPNRAERLLRNPLMWAGFALPVIVGTLNGLNSYFPGVPAVPLTTYLPIFRDSLDVPLHFSFPLTGFSYFIHQSLGLGIWVFYWLTLMEQGVFNAVGLQTSERLGWFSNPDSPLLTHQALGAMLAFALFVLWNARSHLRDVFRRAWNRDHAVTDDDEILSYRAAVLVLVLGLAIMTVWLNQAGIPLLVVPVFLAVALLLFLAISRIVVEAGVALLRAPLIAPDFTIGSFGPSALGGAGLTGLAYTYPWTADIVTFPMVAFANGLKIVDVLIVGARRAVFWGVLLAVLVTLCASGWMVLHLSYTRGGINLMPWFWEYSSRLPLSYIAAVMESPSLTETVGWFFTAGGAVAMWLLMLVHQRVSWWPLHPLGLAISGTQFTSGFMWFSVFVAWSIKVIVLKYGGGDIYHRSRFLFMGMILGAFVTSGTWLVIDYFTGQQGNFTLGGW